MFLHWQPLLSSSSPPPVVDVVTGVGAADTVVVDAVGVVRLVVLGVVASARAVVRVPAGVAAGVVVIVAVEQFNDGKTDTGCMSVYAPNDPVLLRS